MDEQGTETEFPNNTEFEAVEAGDEVAELEELRRELADARPCLEAFAQLERLAEEQGTTPEAIAMQASMDVLTNQHQEKCSELEIIQEAIDSAEADRQLVLDEHTAIVDQMAEMIEELESIRADAVRLLGEKATLEKKVKALRTETDAVAVAVHGERRADDRVLIEVDDDEAVAFDRFFEADVVEDKARAWMLEDH